MKDTGHASQEDNIAFLEDGLGASGEPSSEMDVEAQYESDECDERPVRTHAVRVSPSFNVSVKQYANDMHVQRNRTPSDQYLEIQEMVQSSPVLANQPRIKPRIASLFTQMATSVKISRATVQTEFDDIDVSRSSSSADLGRRS